VVFLQAPVGLVGNGVLNQVCQECGAKVGFSQSSVFNSEPELTSSMLVEYGSHGSHGIQALANLGEAFLELDGFGFVHFRTGGFERALELSQLFSASHDLCRQFRVCRKGDLLLTRLRLTL
jgi:hypothetical protein